MTDKIRDHIEALFDSAPATTRVREAKEELLAGCLDKYEDLLAQGKTPDEAYISVISGIGDVDELLRALGQIEVEDPRGQKYNMRALYISAGVFLIFLGVAVAVLIGHFFGEMFGGITIMLILAAAAAVLIYGISTTKINLPRPGISLTASIQEQMLDGGKGKSMLGAVTSAMWSIITLIYLCAGFFFGWWHPGWLIFVLGAVLQSFIGMVLGGKKLRRGSMHAFIWTMCPFVYLAVSFATGQWAVTWLIFPLTVCLQQILRLMRVWRDNNES